MIFIKLCDKITLNNGDNTGIIDGITFSPDDSNSYTVKLMFWTSPSEMKPLSTSGEFKF